MRYAIKNYAIFGKYEIQSEYMTMEEITELYKVMYRQAARGLRDFPIVMDEYGNEVEIE